MKEPKINNVAIIQYQIKTGEIKSLILKDYDKRRLSNKVATHIAIKNVMSVQFYYKTRTRKEAEIKKEVEQ